MIWKKRPLVEKLGQELKLKSEMSYLYKVSNGLGRLRKIPINSDVAEPYFEECDRMFSLYEWRFDGVPLVYVNAASCETSKSMLMHGYGKRDNSSLASINECTDFSEAQNIITKYLSLMDDGYYCIQETRVVPTDGCNNFFWNIPNEALWLDTTCCAFSPYEDISSYGGSETRYLYPSEFSFKYNQKRVMHYVDYYNEHKKMPFVLVLSMFSSLVLCLDGHHKACACALLGIEIPCILIDNIYSFSQFGGDYGKYQRDLMESNKYDLKKHLKKQMKPYPFPSEKLNTSEWGPYSDTIKRYPSYQEALMRDYLNVQEIDEHLLNQALDERNADMILYIVVNQSRKKDMI